ncbi:hypothetical protein AKJ43_02385 [candidate division MSBL1 archaeon SCGC-AAA261D19]|uniref:ATP--dephospho-CoA triphosphoribosyl transferase CitG n=1 Tax=candidate division MSBL1 archaeon SCGC-AAA261D19 TaxID=1698273 RepID=A0A133V6R4_9EURY|nr:hypothetical protein AKJ43_02385 [candidate division MSBL1 archaeon SCGC-AAA261D19]
MDLGTIAERVARSAQLAALLEVSGYPKPGNVHRTADFPDVRYEHFLAGSIAMGSALRKAAIDGALAGKERIKLSGIRIGEKIKSAVQEVNESHYGGNTHLGMLLLFVPLAAAAGKTLVETGKIELESLRNNFTQIMKSTSTIDSLCTYDAICAAIQTGKGENRKTAKSSWLGRAKTDVPSLHEREAREKLSDENVTLYDWLKASSSWDGIANELTSGMEVSFKVGYPTLMETFEKHKDINISVVHTFLKILSEYPDTLVARKVGLEKTTNIVKAVALGLEKAEWISCVAKSILETGGLTSEEGKKALQELDESLRNEGGKLNPGTTADLTASSLMIANLCGLKF